MMMAQSFPAQVAMQPGHPGLQHGHPIPGGQHPGAHMGGHPGAGMMQGMHPGVSGPQVTGPMVTGMPPGPGTSAPGGPMQQAHAMAHLGPAQQAMFQQHNPQMNFGMNPHAAQHQNIMARQRQHMLQAQQAQQAQHGIPVSMPNTQGINQAQLAQMRANAQAGGMNLPMQQQIQMMQAQAHQQQQQQQQQQQAQQQQPPHNMQQAQQQQQMLAQQQAHQAAMHAQAQQQRQAAQQMQISHSQEPNSQPPQSQSTPAPQPPPQIQQPPNLSQQQQQQPLQGGQQGQNVNSSQQQQGQAMQQQREHQMAQQEAMNQQKTAAMNMNMQRNMQELKPIVGLSILRLVQYQDHLGNPERPDELDYWEGFVAKFFSPEGVLRQQLWNSKNKGDKTYRIEYPSLPRFYLAHFLGGIEQIWMSVLGANEKALVHQGHHTVWSGTASTKYTYKNGNAVITFGQVKVNFDSENRIELLDITTQSWREYIPRELLVPPKSPPDQKESPKLNKNLKRQQQKPAPSVPSPPIPESRVGDYGVPRTLIQYLEMAEVFSAMTPLIQYSQSHPTITPQQALEKMVGENAIRQSQMASMAQGNLNATMQMSGQRTPGLNGPNQFASPAFAHLSLPTGQGSPHLGGPVHTPSPAQNHIAGPVAMVHQQSQQGSNLSGSQTASANTSPNVTNKRRRASAVKVEDDGGGTEVNGTGANKVRPSPRIGGKRQKGTA